MLVCCFFSFPPSISLSIHSQKGCVVPFWRITCSSGSSRRDSGQTLLEGWVWRWSGSSAGLGPCLDLRVGLELGRCLELEVELGLKIL